MEINIKIIESPQISINLQKNEFEESEKEKIRNYFEKTFLPRFGKISRRE